MTKEIVFSAFNFNLMPHEEKNLQFEFNGPKPTSQELNERKYNIYETILKSLSEHKTDKNLFKLIDSENEIYLFKISNKKSTSLVEDFSVKKVQTEPYVYLLIDNSSLMQKIYISEAVEVFKTINSTKNILLNIFNKHLHNEFLKIEIKEIYEKKDFWTLVKDKENKISYINVEFAKPLPFDKAKRLNEIFQNFVGKTNAYKSNILLRAGERSILKNISPVNKDINSLIEHCSKYGGDIKIKFLGERKQVSTNSTIKKIKISESELENINEKLIKTYLEVFKSN